MFSNTLQTITKRTFSLHQIDNRETIPFSSSDYSKFKFGSKDIARKFGREIAKSFYSDLLIHFQNKPEINTQIVVISSPYNFIPTATFALKDYFIQQLNYCLVRDGYPVVEETKIHRTISYREDYGALDAEERMKLIGGDEFHIDEVFCRGKILIFLDDIKITGSHERVIERMYQQYNLENDHFFIYFAELINSQIHPSIENDLNFAYVKNLKDLDKIIKNENFLLNTRTVKYILNYHDKLEVRTFLDYQKQSFINTLYHQAIGNSYHLIPEYKTNLSYLKTLIKL
jgi:hypothetical protein